MISGPDQHFMRLALALAERASPTCRPNPAVGCVLVGAGGVVLGQGYTQVVGQAHAEIMALREARSLDHDVAGATAYVTLEPCAHQGRTPPCCDALIAAGVARVVVATQDPNPRVAGRGLARLRAAGITVDVGAGAAASRELNIGFFSRMRRGRPWVRVKAAASLDGRTALRNGVSQWITGTEARQDGQRWRARADAILTGVGTVLSDDPRLDVRGVVVPQQPLLAIADSRLRTPPDARLWSIADRSVRLYTACPDARAMRILRDRGADVVCLPAVADTGRVDLIAMLRDLATQGCGELHVEAGGVLSGALWQAGLVDALLLYQAPSLLGEGAGVAELGALTTLAQGWHLRYVDVRRVGADLRILARVPGREPWAQEEARSTI